MSSSRRVRRNRRAFQEPFVKVLAVAGESGLVKRVGGVSVDGTKIKANASKHAAVSYKRAGKLIEQLTLEVEELTRKAEEADSTHLEDGLNVPDEITRPKDRIDRLEQARAVIKKRWNRPSALSKIFSGSGNLISVHTQKLILNGASRAWHIMFGGCSSCPKAAPCSQTQFLAPQKPEKTLRGSMAVLF